MAPHPDDEVLGCGGLIQKRLDDGYEVGWLIVTTMAGVRGYAEVSVSKKDSQIRNVSSELGINIENIYQLGLGAATLDTIGLSDLVSAFAKVFCSFKPSEVFLPHPGDAHSDHRVVFEAGYACTKWFRYPFVNRVFLYETVSETEAGHGLGSNFKPNYFVDIEKYLAKKIRSACIYEEEMGYFPFPRSSETIEALAKYRGSQAGYGAAEAFQLIRARESDGEAG